MKIATIIVRTILGLLVSLYLCQLLLHLNPEPASTGEFKSVSTWISGIHIFIIGKIGGILMWIIFCYWKIHNISEPLFFPVTLNILLINYFLDARQLVLIFVFRESIFNICPLGKLQRFI
jgi:hypothetical protein